MAINFPTTLDTTANFPAAAAIVNTFLDGSGGGSANTVHSTLHGATDEAVVAIETKLGIGAGAPSAGKVLLGAAGGVSSWAALDNVVIGGVTPAAGTFTTGVFGGDVLQKTAAKAFASQDPTNTSVYHVGGQTTMTMTDNQTITITLSAINHCGIVIVGDNNDGKAAAFFCAYGSATITEISDVTNTWSVTDTDANPGMAIFKGANSDVVTIKNYMNTNRVITVNVCGPLLSATAPA